MIDEGKFKLIKKRTASNENNLRRPKGCWYNEETNERMFPDLAFENQKERHWDYFGPKFPTGARLYIDGTWSEK